jgi:galactokinase
VSCEEIDFLVKVAQSFDGVYGSRLTGGGFGGCTVTLCQEKHVEALMDHIKKEYKAAYNIECECFETVPGKGARELK